MDSKSSPGSPLRSASSLLFCRMCQAVYRQPKLLPCLHSFCRPCLQDVVTRGADGTAIVCPLCSHKTKLPQDGVTGVPDNCFLSRMCQEYISEVQSHIVARSLYPTTSRGSSEFTELRSKLTEELSQCKHSSPHSKFSQQVQEKSQHATTPDPESTPGQPTAKALEAIYNMGRLQTKIMSLQGEALRVTYAIDHVNQCMIEWHQHKEDSKRAVQRRSAQFQFFLKRMEHQLITQIDGKHVDDEFYTESDRSKTELRKVLKKILHEVSVLKNIQELGNDKEINTLSSDILGKSVGVADVFLKKLHFEIDVPTQSIEEIVADWFGVVRLNPVIVNVFAPEVLDFTEIPMGNLPEQNGQGASPYYEEDRDKYTLDDEEMDSSGAHKNSNRSFSDSSAVRYNDEDLDKEDVREHLVQFQNVRETLRTRRREILVLGQQARDGTSPLRDETHRRPRSAMRRSRVQSLDRIAAPVTKKSSRTGLPTGSNVDETSTLNEEKSCNVSVSVSHPELAFKPHYMTGANHFSHRSIHEDIHVPSPVIEEVSLLHTPQRILVKQTSDPRSMLSSLEEVSGSEAALPSHSQSATEYLSNNASGVDSFRGRRHSSDHYAYISSGAGTHLDLTHDRNPTRLVRRAISGVADRKTKIDFLRENWQKRKEILIQNEGFVSPDSTVKHATKSSPHPSSPTISGSIASFDTSQREDQICTTTHDQNHQMAEDLSCANNDPTEREETGNDDTETYSSLSLRRQASDPHLRTFQSNVTPALTSTQTSSSTVTSVTQQIPVSLAQETTETATTPKTYNTSMTSRYSRFGTKPTEMIDVVQDDRPLTANMYSGKEKSTRYATTNLSNESTSTTEAITDTLNPYTTTSSSTGIADIRTVSPDMPQKLASVTPHSSKHQNENQSHIMASAAVQPGSLESQQSWRYPSMIASRYPEGFNRRHTIEVGQATIQDAVLLTTNEKSSNANILQDISAHIPSQSRSADHLKFLGSNEGSETTPMPLAEPTDKDKIKYVNLRYKIREDTSWRAPSPLQLMQEETLSDHSATSDSSVVLASTSATPPSSPQPPSSPTTSDGSQKVKLRELARKKKERWRHLTIH